MKEDLGIPTHNKAFVLQSVNTCAFEDRPLPSLDALGPYEALIVPKYTGICGSDVHYWKHGRIGNFVLTQPMILGHESSGVVYATGSKVKHVVKGDRVALEPGESCRLCSDCKAGHYNLCPDMQFAATPPFDGTLASFYKLPADLCYKLPDGMSLEEGAMIEPLAVAVHSLTKVGQVKPNANVLVFGAGPVGLLCLAVAKAVSARRVIVVDINADRLQFAKSYAATDAWLPSQRKDDEPDNLSHAKRLVVELKQALGIDDRGIEGIDFAVDATGAEVCIQTALLALKPRGTYVQVGLGKSDVVVPMSDIVDKELNIKGSFRYGPDVYQTAIDLVASRKIDLGPLVTHRYKFEDAELAYHVLANNQKVDGKFPIKVMIQGAQ